MVLNFLGNTINSGREIDFHKLWNQRERQSEER